MYVTRHGSKRIHDRAGIPLRAVDKNAHIALIKGVRHNETTGALRAYLDRLFLRERTANNMRIWQGCVYIFCNQALVTVLILPQVYRKKAESLLRRKKKEESHDTETGRGLYAEGEGVSDLGRDEASP